MTLTPWTRKLRIWQDRAYAEVMRHAGSDFLTMACPGAGKTTFGLRIGHARLSDRAVDRIVIVCPTNHLRGQWARAGHSVGIRLDPALTNEQTTEARDYHGAVVTYQQVSQAPKRFAQACTKKRTLVLFDELHHAGDGKRWGQSLQEAFEGARCRQALSGTPFRSDNVPIPFVRYEDRVSRPDFRYGYAEALADGVCRPILFPAYEGELTWKSAGVEHQATFADPLSTDRARERLKTALLHPDWVGSVLRDAHAQLRELRARDHPAAGGLVIAMNQDHARQIAGQLESIPGHRVPVAISDDPEASGTIQLFGQTSQAWLVAVNMVSEGVDIPRLRVGVYATNVLTEMYFRQAVGRFVRMQPGLPRSQRAYLYLPHDETLVDHARRIQCERDHVLHRRDPQAGLSLFEAPSERGSTYEPLKGVARPETIIGSEGHTPETPQTFNDIEEDTAPVATSPEGENPDVSVERPVFEQKDQLRTIHSRLVGSVARTTGKDHRTINQELIRRCGGRIESATIEQLNRRIILLEQWRDKGAVT